MIILRTAMLFATIVPLALLRAATITAAIIVTPLIGHDIQHRAGTEHQHTETGNQAFGHFHQLFLTASNKKG